MLCSFVDICVALSIVEEEDTVNPELATGSSPLRAAKRPIVSLLFVSTPI